MTMQLLQFIPHLFLWLITISGYLWQTSSIRYGGNVCSYLKDQDSPSRNGLHNDNPALLPTIYPGIQAPEESPVIQKGDELLTIPEYPEGGDREDKNQFFEREVNAGISVDHQDKNTLFTLMEDLC
jgi:hypothetical protein